MNPSDKDKKEEKQALEKDKQNKEAAKLDPETLFWMYFDMGENRSLRRLARENNDTFTRIKHLSTKYKWSERIKQALEQDAETQEEINMLATHTEMMQYRVAKNILNSPDAKAADKLKALDYMSKLMEKAQDIKRKKIVVIEFDNIEELQRVVDKINAERYREIKMRQETESEIKKEKDAES